MIYLFDIESENLPELLKSYHSIGDVVQVRCHRVLRQQFKKLVGDEGLYITCIVRSKTNDDKFVKFEEILPRNVWDDPTCYEQCLFDMKQRVDDYVFKGKRPVRPAVMAKRLARELEDAIQETPQNTEDDIV